MAKDTKNLHTVFDGLCGDINSITKKEWNAIQEMADILEEVGLFKRDPMKCLIGAFVLWVHEYAEGLETALPEASGDPDPSLH